MHLSPPSAWAAVRFKAVVLLLLIYCLMNFPLFVGVLCLSFSCYELHCVHSSFAIILEGEEKAGCFAIIVLQMFVTINVLYLFLAVL